MSEHTHTVSSGIGLPTALFITFLVLKLCGVIGWSWWWVTCPLWIPFAVLLGGGLVVLLIVGVAALIAAIAK